MRTFSSSELYHPPVEFGFAEGFSSSSSASSSSSSSSSPSLSAFDLASAGLAVFPLVACASEHCYKFASIFVLVFEDEIKLNTTEQSSWNNEILFIGIQTTLLKFVGRVK